MIRENRLGDKVFYIVNGAIMVILILITLLPFLQVIAEAFSDNSALMAGKVLFWPVKFQTNAISYVVKGDMFRKSFFNSVMLTALGTAISIVLTAMTAYPLSKTQLKGRKWLLLYFVFTMLFSGGIVPMYLLMHRLKLLNTYLALILPGMSVFNMLILKNFFEAVPESLEESAMLDGAGNTTILIRIYLPLSIPAIATLCLFYAVGYWNSYFSALIYITDVNKTPLQLYLRSIIYEASMSDINKNQRTIEELMNVSTQSVIASTIIASTLPIILVYPFIQKYFIKGIMIGSVKG